ncbi:MAG: efflux RND transporter periplasmic adaptor subunit [Pseudomonadota bacterium]
MSHDQIIAEPASAQIEPTPAVAKPAARRLRMALLGGAALGAFALGVVAYQTQIAAPAAETLVVAENAAPQATPVDVAFPEIRRITEWDEYTGRFAAVDSVQVRARVSGYLDAVHFDDGRMVEVGDLLFTIDQRPFQAALAEARAERVGAEAGLENARAEHARGQELLSRNTISREAAETRLRTLREAEAAVQAAEARVARAELDLSFTEIRAPVAGRISDDAVSVGNLITGGAEGGTPLTNIVSLDPIDFEFTVSEADYLKYVRLDRSGAREGSRSAANRVGLQLMDEDGFLHEGEMRFVDNQLDASTGTMRGRAVFNNPDRVFAPGMFARIRLAGSAEYDAVLIADAAVQTDQGRRFVWVVDADNAAQRRPIELGPLVDGLRVVRAGLSAEDRVIVGGAQFIGPGAPVAPRGEEKPAALNVAQAELAGDLAGDATVQSN